MSIKQFIKSLLPENCLGCQKLSSLYICKTCYKQLLPISLHHQFINHLQVYSMVEYQSTIKTLFHELKFNRNKRTGNILKHITTIGFKHYLNQARINTIIYVPSHKKRIQKRSFNHLHFLLEKNKVSLPIIKTEITRTKHTPPLVKLTKKERQLTLRDCFTLSSDISSKIINKHILIYDDIVTTGATVLELSHVLTPFKPKSIQVLTTAYVKKSNL